MPVEPKLEPRVCGEMVCFTAFEVVDITRYLRGVREVEWALAGCPAVVTP